ncbi:hypothetical protein MKZ38_001052 [Zalerion maritima]|uniref:Uncharacterized protein n=1 Tax=Zalerion maritima TaxID=339359 RepID=A0AAD5WS70_9PEZI|nr:hypothetical protein MKZ38_001052 [Zalerion maritima]
MAFRQPQRQLRIIPVEDDRRPTPQPAPQAIPPLVESQTRIIFSPATDAITPTSSIISPTQRTVSTPGRSRFSDLGSLQSAVVRSIHNDDDSQLLSATYSEALEDDAELDSLDSHLPEFRATPSQAELLPFSHSNPVLPTHDGLGSFHLDHPAASVNVQEQLYAFEKFNPRRVKRRRESLELAQRELEGEEARDAEKMRRIESWRLEQSKYLLQEIEKETRRRGINITAQSPVSGSQRQRSQADADSESRSTEWHDQDDPAGQRKKDVTWTQTIKSVIRELVSIEDKILSVLFGEALPDEDDDLSSTPRASELNISTDAITQHDQNWQDRILARIARELGLLVHRLSDHPGAFSTYVRMQQMPLPYAGLPVIPEAAVPDQQSSSDGSVASIQFQPTIKHAMISQPIDIPSAKQTSAPASNAAQAGNDEYGSAFTQQEWEQELDIKMVFRYLRSRFTSRSAASSPPVISATATSASHFGLASSQDAAAKAARVRLHHPLVSRSRPVERRTFKATVPTSPITLRHASSCASQSTRRSVRRGSGSSRHYWDIGASVGTGSIIASTGPMGSWGDV